MTPGLPALSKVLPSPSQRLGIKRSAISVQVWQKKGLTVNPQPQGSETREKDRIHRAIAMLKMP